MRARVIGFLAGLVMATGVQAATLAGLSYSPSGANTFEDLTRGVSEDRLRADLTQLKELTGEIRIYSVDQGIDRVVPLAAQMGFKVTLGIWLGADPAENAAQIAHGISIAKGNHAAITRIIVGNEAVQRHDVTPEQLIQAMEEVRRGIGRTAIPVGTAEIWSVWLAHPELADAAAFIGAHIIPYWDGVTVDEAPSYVQSRIDELQHTYPGKPIVVAETGWPSAGPVHQGAVPSPENQAKYVSAIATGGLTHSHAYFIIEAYDQPWKLAGSDPATWGLFDVQRHPKPVVDALRKATPRTE